MNIKYVLEPGDFIVPIDECAIEFLTPDKEYEVVRIESGDPVIVNDIGIEVILLNFDPNNKPPFNKNEIKYVINKEDKKIDCQEC